MYIEIIRRENELSRQVWRFTIDISYSGSCIYFDYYHIETRRTSRCNWVISKSWTRLERRYNTIQEPILPDDVKAEALQHFANNIKTLPFKQ